MASKITFSQFLSEAPLPDDWDGSIYNERIPFKTRLAYAKERAKRLGQGSSRVAFVIPYQGRDTVLKIAKNRKGMAQNEAEARILGDGYASRIGIFIPMIDYDTAGDQPTWIHTELAGKVTDQNFVQASGGTLTDLLAYVREQRSGKPSHYGNAKKVDPDSELAQNFYDYVENFDANIDDYSNLSNWGMYEGSPVIIDAGYDDDVAKLYR